MHTCGGVKLFGNFPIQFLLQIFHFENLAIQKETKASHRMIPKDKVILGIQFKSVQYQHLNLLPYRHQWGKKIIKNKESRGTGSFGN